MPENSAAALNNEQTTDFEQIEREAGRQNHNIEEVLGFAGENTDTAPYEANRVESKNLLKTELSLYLMRFPDDQKYCDTLRSLIGLTEMDVTYSPQVWQEGEAYDKGIKNLQNYLSDLDDEEKALRKVSEKLFKRKGKNGKPEWIPDEVIDADPELHAKDIQLSVKAEIIDEKRLIFTDLAHYLEAQRNGRLVITEPDARIINASGKDFNILDYSDAGNWRNQHPKPVYTSVKNHTNAPLFPHEPNANDISQGEWGNCFLLAALSNIARLHPEKIKENIRENADGKTATVRLFSKSRDGKYSPVYVTVDKTSEKESLFSDKTIGSRNCLWVNCFEKALVASGLYSSLNTNETYWEPVPNDIEQKYKELKKLSDKGRLTGDTLENARKEYPALFTSYADDDNNKHIMLMPWPSYESINGGRIGRVTELLMGPEYSNKEIDTSDVHHSLNNKKYINLDISTPEKFMAFSVANERDCLLEDHWDAHTKDFDFSGSEEELITRAITSNSTYYNRDNGSYNFDERMIRDSYHEALDAFRTLMPDLSNQTSETLLITLGRPGVSDSFHDPDDIKSTMKQDMFMALFNTAGSFSEYTTAENKLFNKIKSSVDQGLLVGAGSIGEDPNHGQGNNANARGPVSVAGGHAYSVVKVFDDHETGKRIVRLRNPWGDDDSYGFKNGFKDIDFHSFVNDMKRVDINGRARVNAPAANQDRQPYRGPAETGVLDFNSYMRYLTAIDDACVAYSWTERAFDGSSKEYKDLKTTLKQTRHNLLKLKDKPFDEVKKLMKNLNEKIEAYDKRCQEVPKNNWRRNTRMQITSMLKDVVKCSEMSMADPTRSIKQGYATKVARAIAENNHVQLTPEKAAAQGAELLKSPEFRAAIKDKNLFTMKSAGNKDVQRQANTITAIRKKNSVFADKKPIARNIE